MLIYARIQDGIYVERIAPVLDPDGNQVPVDALYEASVVQTFVDISTLSPEPNVGSAYDGEFSEAPGPSVDDLIAAFDSVRTSRILAATQQIAWLQDAVDLGEDQPGDAQLLLAWKKYRIAVNRMTFSADVQWPDIPGELQ